jgi:hypothetical protein
MEEFILENWKYGVWFICCSGIVLEISPIKVSPISAILRWLGNKLNRDVETKLIQLETKVDTVQTDLQNHKVESWRRDILNFSDSLMLGRDKSKDQFTYIIALHDSYEKYIAERGLINGQLDAAFEYIMKRYHECLENNSFYTGK